MRETKRQRERQRMGEKIRLENTLFFTIRPTTIYTYNGITLHIFFRQRRHLKTSYTKRFITSQNNNLTKHILGTVFYNIIQYFLKYKFHPIASKIDRGVCRNLFFLRQNPPPPATVLRQSPVFKRNNPLLVPTPKYCAAHPSVLLISIFWSQDLNTAHYFIIISIIIIITIIT